MLRQQNSHWRACISILQDAPERTTTLGQASVTQPRFASILFAREASSQSGRIGCFAITSLTFGGFVRGVHYKLHAGRLGRSRKSLRCGEMPLQAKPMGGGAKSLPPPNKKYANVKARLDTGCNELKIKSSETKANARFHRGENFRRLKVQHTFTSNDLQIYLVLLSVTNCHHSMPSLTVSILSALHCLAGGLIKSTAGRYLSGAPTRPGSRHAASGSAR